MMLTPGATMNPTVGGRACAAAKLYTPAPPLRELGVALGQRLQREARRGEYATRATRRPVHHVLERKACQPAARDVVVAEALGQHPPHADQLLRGRVWRGQAVAEEVALADLAPEGRVCLYCEPAGVDPRLLVAVLVDEGDDCRPPHVLLRRRRWGRCGRWGQWKWG